VLSYRTAMSTSSNGSVTALLERWKNGDDGALHALTPLIYAELRRLAGIQLARESSGHTLQPTALVHEAFLRLVSQDNPDWRNRAHFLAVASQLMRQVLVDHARRRRAVKRGGDLDRVPLDVALTEVRQESIIVLDDALEALAKVEPRKARAIELRYFGGLSNPEIASVLNISIPTVKRDIRVAEVWLGREMESSPAV